MNKEIIDKLNDCDLGFYVNLDASGIDNEDGNFSADDFDSVDYSIKDGKLLSWSGEEIMDLCDIDDSWWEDAMNPDEDDETEPMTWFECFISELLNHVLENGLIGDYEFRNLINDERILLVLLRHPEKDIIEEIDEWDIVAHVD